MKEVSGVIILEKAREEELFCTYALKSAFGLKKLYVGDDTGLPDIFLEDRSLGIEVVQAEKEIDHKQNSLMVNLKKNNFEYAKFSKYPLEEEKEEENPPPPISLVVKDGKVKRIKTSEGAHPVDWLLPEYEQRLRSKLEKLNTGNYARVAGGMALCVLSRNRIKDLFDFLLLLYQYSKIKHEYEKKFDEIYFITSEAVFTWKNTEHIEITPRMSNGIIFDFDRGESFRFEKIEYDYNEIHQMVQDALKIKNNL